MVIIGAGLIILLVLGVPVSFAVGAASVVGAVLLTDISGMEIFAGMLESLCDPLLLAVPLFILAANLMNEGKATDRLIDVGTALLGHRRGGLAYVNILVSMIFAGVTGSSQEDTVSVGKNLIPSMARQGYDRKTAVGVTAASSTIGSVIPPSVSMVVFSTLVHVDTAELFLCGLLPGVLLGLFMMAAVWLLNRKKHFPSGERAERETVKRLIMESLPALLTPVILIGGIVSGWFTVTEAAMFACLYSLVTGIFFYGEIKPSRLPGIFVETMKAAALPLFAFSTAGSLGKLVSYYNLDGQVLAVFSGMEGDPFIFLLAVEILLLAVGMFMDASPAMILLVPILQPASAALGVPLLALGLTVVITLSLGLVTPPYGPCLLIASGIGGLSMEEGFRGTLPYFLSSVLVLLLLAAAPQFFAELPVMLFPGRF